MTKEKKSAAEKQGFFARNHKPLHIAVISVMCLLIALCVKLSIDHHVLRDVFATANTYILCSKPSSPASAEAGIAVSGIAAKMVEIVSRTARNRFITECSFPELYTIIIKAKVLKVR